MNKTINIKYVVFISLIYFCCFQNLIQVYFPIFSYVDEFLALLSVPIMIIKWKKINESKNFKYIIVCLVLLFCVGILGNYIYKYQPIYIVLSDVIVFFKFYLILFLSNILWDYSFLKKRANIINFHINVIVLILLFCTFLNYSFRVWPDDIRFGIMANKLFYTHTTYLASVCVFLFSLSIFFGKKIISLRNIILLIILLSTLRFKAIGAFFLMLCVVYYVYKKRKIITFSKFALLGIVCLFIVWNQINYYYIELSQSARNQLTVKSIEIAKDYFPLGTGFGTYCSNASSINYSPIYYIYGLNMVHGLNPSNPAFLSDVFWPEIIGQFGFVGLFLYIIVIKYLFSSIKKAFDKNSINIYISKLVCFVYLLISSTSETAFVHPIAMSFAIIIGIMYKNEKGKIYE